MKNNCQTFSGIGPSINHEYSHSFTHTLCHKHDGLQLLYTYYIILVLRIMLLLPPFSQSFFSQGRTARKAAHVKICEANLKRGGGTGGFPPTSPCLRFKKKILSLLKHFCYLLFLMKYLFFSFFLRLMIIFSPSPQKLIFFI